MLGDQHPRQGLQEDALGATEDVSRDVDLQLQVDFPSVQAPKILEVDDNTPLEALMNPGDVQIRFRWCFSKWFK